MATQPTKRNDECEAISFRQLRLFESIGRLQSVRRASEECNLSQPAVTQSLAKLEELVGSRLIERRASGSYLNRDGEIFHRRVARFIGQFESALGEFQVEGGAAGARAAAGRLLRSQVRVLVAIVEANGIGAAADELGLAAATIQRAARDLESNLGKPLFYRTASGVVPTVEAVRLATRLKLALQEVTWGVGEIGAAHGETITPITVGAMPLGGNVVLAHVLERWLEGPHKSTVLVRNEGSMEMIRRLRAGDVDMMVGLISPLAGEDLACEALMETPHSIVSRRGHPLAARPRIGLDDLAGCEWLVGAPGASRRECFENLFRDRTRPATPVATSALPIIKHLLLTSNRLTLMTSYEMENEGEGLVALPYGPVSPVPAFGITTRANWLPTPAHLAFMQLIREQLAGSTQPRLRAVS